MAQNDCGGVKFTSYSGAYTTSEVTLDGVKYTLYTLTGSGTLVLEGRGEARVWMCGGGGNGYRGSASTWANGGGGGGGGYVTSGVLASGIHTVTIGARTGATSFVHAKGTTLSANPGSNASSSNGGSGGSGGGAGRKNGSNGKGAGVSTYPFGLTSLYAHSAGGGGGAVLDSSTTEYFFYGYEGGSNGKSASKISTASYAAGGERGGGKGGWVSKNEVNGSSATFYGSGGGGGGAQPMTTTHDEYEGSAGYGYQGVAYVLIPAA